MDMYSGDVECHAFSGSPSAVSRALYQLPPALVRRCFVTLLLQGEGKADIRIFERDVPDAVNGLVSDWSGSELGPLPGQVVATLMAGPVPGGGDNQVRAALREHGQYVERGAVPCPPTARGAFGHPLKPYSGEASVHALVVAA